MRMPTLCSFNTLVFFCVFLYSDQKQVYTNLFLFAKTNMYICMCMNRHFVEPSHVTYPPLNLRLGTLWVPEMKKAGNILK